MTSYEVTKTIRFISKQGKDVPAALRMHTDGASQEKLLGDLIEKAYDVEERFRKLFWYTKSGVDGDADGEVKRGFQIKYGWLRTYTKHHFYDWQAKKMQNDEKKDRRYDLTHITYLPDEFRRWLAEWHGLITEAQTFTDRERHTKLRRRDAAFTVRGFARRNMFEFMEAFANAIVDTQEKDIDEKLSEFRDALSEFNQTLKGVNEAYLPAQSGGVLVAKASLNYYTLNKFSKEGLDKKKTDLEAQLTQERMHPSVFRVKWREGSGRNSHEIMRGCTSAWLKSVRVVEDVSSMSYEDAYQYLHDWKAEQKRLFEEAVRGGTVRTVVEAKKMFPLFEASEGDFKRYIELTHELDTLNTQNNRRQFELEIRTVAQRRGEFFNAPHKKVQTPEYKQLCELYKKIALERGKLKASIKGIEAESVDAQLLRYLGIIVERDGRHFLALVPRDDQENHKKAHEVIVSKAKKPEGRGEVTVHHIKSLTFRSLWKLCFKEENNSFFPEISKELSAKMNEYRHEHSREPSKGDVSIAGRMHLLRAGFYQDVLCTQYARKNLDLVDFGELNKMCDKEYPDEYTPDGKPDVSKFESDLEKTCYVRKMVPFTTEEWERFVSTYSVVQLDITSQDIRIAHDLLIASHQEKLHTTMWREFWSDTNAPSYDTRLNPEVSLFYREADTDLQRQLEAKPLPTKLKWYRNRFAQEQLTAAMTLTLNAATKKSRLAFKTTKDIAVFVDQFNKDFDATIRQHHDPLWIYGIDRGTKELASLSVLKFSEGSNGEHAPIQAWRIKDPAVRAQSPYDTEGRKLVIGENPSYFVPPDNTQPLLGDFFEKVQPTYIDLTTAKVVRGRLILNGDTQTIGALREAAARRRLWELYSRDASIADAEKVRSSDAKINNAFVISVRGKDGGLSTKKVDYINEMTESEVESHCRTLNAYLNELRKGSAAHDVVPQEKVDHLRDAVAANMVGVIAYLQGKYEGIVVLEDLQSEEHIDKHFNQTNASIARRLEWALYRKFQNSTGFLRTPPQTKQTLSLRECKDGEKKTDQFGGVFYVDDEGTSQDCSMCGERKPVDYVKNKWRGKYVCGSCHTTLPPDENATRNIAKRGWKLITDKKLNYAN